ncbi:MAG: hypothetical protein P8078_02160, partial [bacterium]
MEDFDDNNIHDGMPVDWYTTGSYWDIGGGDLYWNSSASSAGQCSHPTFTAADFEAEYDLSADDYYNATRWAGFCFRKNNYSDSYNDSGYMFFYRYNGDIHLLKPFDNLIATVSTGLWLNTTRHIKLRVKGTNIKVWVDNTLYIDT